MKNRKFSDTFKYHIRCSPVWLSANYLISVHYFLIVKWSKWYSTMHKVIVRIKLVNISKVLWIVENNNRILLSNVALNETSIMQYHQEFNFLILKMLWLSDNLWSIKTNVRKLIINFLNELFISLTRYSDTILMDKGYFINIKYFIIIFQC